MGRRCIDRFDPDQGVHTETWADAEVEIVDERDKNQDSARAVGQQTPPGTLEEMLLQRRRPRCGDWENSIDWLNSRKGSLNATYRKNTDANDKANDLNQKSVQALDALAKEYVDSEATMANVTSEHEAGDVLHAATLEVTEELERAQKDQGRLQDDLDCSCDALAAATKVFPDCWAALEATGVKLCNAFREVCNRRAAHEESCVDEKKALQRTLEVERKDTEIQEGVATHTERTRRITNEHARAEGHVNDGIGSLGRALQAAAKATHSPDMRRAGPRE